jgi:two-component system chemotaxis sensor kinase CheA
MSHGIESGPEARQAAGKPAIATLTARAFHRGGNIYVELEDDGKGLDSESILERAKERGLVDSGESLSYRDVCSLIFCPGFSGPLGKAKGGMDAVRESVEELRGRVDVHSEPGQGTCFSIQLPLTLSIIEGMVASVATERFIVPTLSVLRLVRPSEMDRVTVLGGGEMLKLDGELLTVCRLGRLFGIEGAKDDVAQSVIMVIESGEQRLALMVDEILGQQQTVIKELGGVVGNVSGLAGGAIMPDGCVGLILDVKQIVALGRTNVSGT